MPEDEGPRPLSADSVARDLRQARADSGQDLDSIAQGLRIRYDYLLAIEEGRYEDLPGPTYAVGFVRAYADYLHLDGDGIANRFKAEVADFTGKTELHFPSPPPEGRLPGGGLIMISAVLIAGAYGAWYFLSNQPDRIAERSSVPEVVSPAVPEVAEPAVPEIAVAEPETAAVPETPAAAEDSAAAIDPVDAGGAFGAEEAPASEAVDPAPAPEQSAAEAAEPQPAEDTTGTEAAEAPESSDAGPDGTPAAESVEAQEAAAGGPEAPEPPAATAAAERAPAAETETPVPATETETTDVTAGQETAPETARAESAAVESETETAAGEAAPEPAQSDPEPVLDTDAVEAEAAEAAGGPEAEVAEGQETSAGPEAIEVGVAPLPPPRRPEVQLQPDSVQTAVLGGAGESEVLGSENGDSRIVVRAVFDSYVLIRDANDKLLLTKVLRRGDSYRVPDQSGLTMLTGNAGGLQIEVDGQQAPSVGAVGAIVRNITLDPQRLQSGTAVNR